MFEGSVRQRLEENDGLARIILPLLETWRDVRRHAANLDRQFLVSACECKPARLPVTVPRVGAITPVKGAIVAVIASSMVIAYGNTTTSAHSPVHPAGGTACR